MAKAYEELELQDDFMFGVIIRSIANHFWKRSLALRSADWNIRKARRVLTCRQEPRECGWMFM